MSPYKSYGTILFLKGDKIFKLALEHSDIVAKNHKKRFGKLKLKKSI